MRLVVKKILVPTVFGKDESADKIFTDYLDEYSIEYKVLDVEEASKSVNYLRDYPLLEYSGGVVSLSNMLKEKFGYTREDIMENYPELYEDVE